MEMKLSDRMNKGLLLVPVLMFLGLTVYEGIVFLLQILLETFGNEMQQIRWESFSLDRARYFGGFLIWAIRANGRKLRIRESARLGLIVALLLMFLLPCLCAPRETGRRIRCISNLKYAWLELLEKYPDKLPDSFVVSFPRSHTVRYCSAGRSGKESRFILFEDGRGHAGDLRHRFWSEGKIDVFYPWGNE